jgi:hypothetical protein
MEWLPTGGHVPHRRLQAANAHRGASKAPLHKSGNHSEGFLSSMPRGQETECNPSRLPGGKTGRLA